MKKQYAWVNWGLASLLFLMFACAGIYSVGEAAPPIACYYKLHTGKDCPTCGISRSFVCLMKGDIAQAQRFHAHSLLLFGVFAFELLLRLLINLLFKTCRVFSNPKTIYALLLADISMALLLFGYVLIVNC